MSRYVMRDETDLEAVRLEAERFYSSIESVRCPYFGDDVVFNTKGIQHLKFKARGKGRSHQDLYPRLKLLYHVPEVLKLSRTVQGICRTSRFEDQKTNNRWEHVLKEVTFYEFVAVVENIRLKVVIKEVSGGIKHFWSVMPFWKFDPDTNERLLYDRRSSEEFD